ncbi:hypothetical protein [Halalkalibacter alkalisediminis]|uniref:Uncharacterized protein n=1 Tax=Halalkalibacter alkalisediminis TaxID=935616 RepID=A0ABV6NH79_9BACI|nr:hypothetical protein [Halalkalibacter alkalisediminis]
MWDKDEEELITKGIYLPLVRKVLERDVEKLKKAELKFIGPYLLLVERTIIKIGLELGKVKRQLSQKGIYIYNEGIKEGLCLYLIVIRGYRQEKKLFPHLMKQSVETYINEYLNPPQNE